MKMLIIVKMVYLLDKYGWLINLPERLFANSLMIRLIFFVEIVFTQSDIENELLAL